MANGALPHMPGGAQNEYAHESSLSNSADGVRHQGDFMTSRNPFAAINLNGDGNMRGLTLALPTDTVRDLLPCGLELGSQTVTPTGTHPVILFFHDLFRAHMSVPALTPSLTYHEHSMGIPYSYLSRHSITPGHPGPYYFMPRLFLDNPIATFGGLLGWGFTKKIASIQVTADRFTISDSTGQVLTSMSWRTKNGGGFRPVSAWPYFEPIRQMLDQPLIAQVPAGMGPFFALSDFDKDWDVATLRPLETSLDVDVEYVAGYPGGRYPSSDWSPGIDESVLGSYELRSPWRLSLPYPPLLSFRK
jgi:Acetoacetate decarboxylase (ADC)